MLCLFAKYLTKQYKGRKHVVMPSSVVKDIIVIIFSDGLYMDLVFSSCYKLAVSIKTHFYLIPKKELYPYAQWQKL